MPLDFGFSKSRRQTVVSTVQRAKKPAAAATTSALRQDLPHDAGVLSCRPAADSRKRPAPVGALQHDHTSAVKRRRVEIEPIVLSSSSLSLCSSPLPVSLEPLASPVADVGRDSTVDSSPETLSLVKAGKRRRIVFSSSPGPSSPPISAFPASSRSAFPAPSAPSLPETAAGPSRSFRKSFSLRPEGLEQRGRSHHGKAAESAARRVLGLQDCDWLDPKDEVGLGAMVKDYSLVAYRFSTLVAILAARCARHGVQTLAESRSSALQQLWARSNRTWPQRRQSAFNGISRLERGWKRAVSP